MSSIDSCRRRTNDAQHAGLASRLTVRDRQIALDCHEHRVLTTAQLKRLHFATEQTARRRLLILHKLGVLDRFRPLTPRGQGSAPYHWVLGQAGARLVAAHHELPYEQLRYRPAQTLAIAASPKLAHHLEVNELVTRLAVEAARAGGALAEWYGERTLHRLFAGRITPDSYTVIQLPDQPPIHLLIEVDRDTEPAARLREKATRYARAIPRSALRDTPPLILLAVPTPARARAASAAVAGTGAPITVTVWSAVTTRPLLPLVTEAATRPTTRADLRVSENRVSPATRR